MKEFDECYIIYTLYLVYRYLQLHFIKKKKKSKNGVEIFNLYRKTCDE